MSSARPRMESIPPVRAPRVIAWETTRRCPLNCRHCRGGARNVDYEGELSTSEAHRVIDGLAEFGSPVLILTGGEPMVRPDIYELAEHASAAGLRVAMAPCGPLLDAAAAERLLRAGVTRVSLSVDAATPAAHDAFRGVQGAFQTVMEAIHAAFGAGLPFQINTTVTRLNSADLPRMLELAHAEGAVALDLFFLVPTGRGEALKDIALSSAEHERTLRWVLEARSDSPIPIRVTCAPHMARIERMSERSGARSSDHQATPPRGRPTASSGCMAGRGFLFISHRGILQPCGFLDVACGDLRAAAFDSAALCANSPVLKALANPDALKGKCGICEFRHACGGCRARAFAEYGDFLAEEPACAYVPRAREMTP